MIKLITFDLDDTLWDNGPVIRRAIQEGYSWLLQQCPRLAAKFDIESLNVLKEQIRTSTPELAHRVSEVRIVGMQQALEQVGYEPDPARQLAQQAFQVFHHWRHQVKLFDGVQDVLARLAEEYSLAVITNGNADVNIIGLGQYFDFTISAEDINRSKPDPQVFQRALLEAGIMPEQALHVGDNLITDVQGAAAVGMSTIWFHPGQPEPAVSQGGADLTVTSLRDIPAAVQELNVNRL